MLQGMLTVTWYPKPLPLALYRIPASVLAVNLRPSEDLDKPPNLPEALCASCLVTRATTSQRNGERKVQEGTVDTEGVPCKLLPESSHEGDYRKKRIQQTHREKLEVLQLHGQHFSIAEIAWRLYCSEGTVHRLPHEGEG